MPYNPKIHHRRSIRLKGYDYSKAGAYFITICCAGMECRFGQIVGASLAGALDSDKGNTNQHNIEAQMHLNDYGKIAYNEWAKLGDRFSNFELDVFQIMPNHMHGIIVLNEPDVDGTVDPNGQHNTGQPRGIAPTVGDIVGAYKSLVVHEILDLVRNQSPEISLGNLWQRNFYEHIIRNEKSYQTISNYIINNPGKWRDDKFFRD